MTRTQVSNRSLRGPVFRWAAAALLAAAAPAWAVVPGLSGPLQSLLQALPQLLPFLLAALVGAAGRFRPRTGPRWCRLLLPALGITAAAMGVLALTRPSAPRWTGPAPGTAPPPTGDWTMFRGDAARSGSRTASGMPDLRRPAWAFREAGADFVSSPTVTGGRVYVGAASTSLFQTGGQVFCLDADRGDRVWQYSTSRPVFSSPAVAGGRLFIGEGLHQDTRCRLHCLDAATGRPLWSVETASHVESSPAVLSDRVYFGAGEDGVYCLEAATGARVWHLPGRHVDLSPLVDSGKVFTGTGYGRLATLALDAATGKPLWETPSDLPVWGSPALAGGKVFYGLGNGDFGRSADRPAGAVWCLDAATGRPTWRRNLPDAVLTAVLVRGDRVFAGCRDGKVYALDAASGTRVWSAPCGSPVVASLAAAGEHLWAAGSGGRLVCLRASDGQRLGETDLSGWAGPDLKLYGSPAAAGGRLYTGTSAGLFLCFDRKKPAAE